MGIEAIKSRIKELREWATEEQDLNILDILNEIEIELEKL